MNIQDSHNGKATKLSLDEIASQLGTSKRNEKISDFQYYTGKPLIIKM